jgi:hypothetical protein
MVKMLSRNASNVLRLTLRQNRIDGALRPTFLRRDEWCGALRSSHPLCQLPSRCLDASLNSAAIGLAPKWHLDVRMYTQYIISSMPSHLRSTIICSRACPCVHDDPWTALMVCGRTSQSLLELRPVVVTRTKHDIDKCAHWLSPPHE